MNDQSYYPAASRAFGIGLPSDSDLEIERLRAKLHASLEVSMQRATEVNRLTLENKGQREVLESFRRFVCHPDSAHWKWVKDNECTCVSCSVHAALSKKVPA